MVTISNFHFVEIEKLIFMLSLLINLMISKLLVSTIDDQTSLLYRRAEYLHHKLLKHLEVHQLVKGLLKLSFTKDPSPCGPCLQRKQKYVSYKVKNQVNISRCLQLLHIDLVECMQTRGLIGKFIFVIVDDYSRYTCVLFLTHISNAF